MYLSEEDEKKVLDAISRRIEETNARFEAADKSTRRVMLAKDVLLQLVNRRMLAESTYFHPLAENFWQSDCQIRDRLKAMPSCRVCGIGSLFVAAVERLNKITCSEFATGEYEYGERKTMIRYIEGLDLFSADELDQIEWFFECMRDYQSSQFSELRKKWGDSERSHRLRRIMEVIIRTEGRKTITLDLLMRDLPTGEFDPEPIVSTPLTAEE